MSRSPWRCYFFAHSFVNYYYDSIETATTSKNKEKKNEEEDNLEDSNNFSRKTDGKKVGGGGRGGGIISRIRKTSFFRGRYENVDILGTFGLFKRYILNDSIGLIEINLEKPSTPPPIAISSIYLRQP